MANKNVMTVEERLTKAEKQISDLKENLRYAMRVVNIIGDDFEHRNLSESFARKWARRAHHLSNGMREVRQFLKEHGNEFDREPHMDDPEKDYQWRIS